MERSRQSGCEVIQADGDADVEIAKAAISMSAFKPTTLVGEDTDFLVLLLYHAVVSNVPISISTPTRWNQTSIIPKSSSWCLEKQFARTYCFSMPLLDATRCPEYLASGRSQRSNESSRTKRQWKTGRPPSHCSIKYRRLSSKNMGDFHWKYRKLIGDFRMYRNLWGLFIIQWW